MSRHCGSKSAEVRGGHKEGEQNRRLEFCEAKSTMAQYVMQDLVEKTGLTDLFFSDPVATSTEKIKSLVDLRARRKLQEEGIHCGNHCAR
jgi:protein tyrosine phosphatase